MKNEENQEQEEKKINKLKYFYLLYKHNSGFKALVKLCLYFILILIILIVVGSSGYGNKKEQNEKDTTSVTEPVKETKSYKDILNMTLTDGKSFTYEIVLGEEQYLITYDINEFIISGLYEDATGGLKRFTIKEGLVYEVILNEEVENPILLSNMNMSYLNIYNLIELLETSKSVKMLDGENTIYKYALETSDINVYVNEEVIKEINITGEGLTYKITIK